MLLFQTRASLRMATFSVVMKFESSLNVLQEFFINYGEYYTGNKFTYGGNLSTGCSQLEILLLILSKTSFGSPNEYVKISLISPRIDLTFTKKVFFTTFIQYNTQINNININARFQYRFKPMSDLFVVYTDNYNSNVFGIKNRAVVVKLVYWFNV